MPDNIAGYTDKTYIKGQYYRYAASPKPVVFNGNIDDIVGTDLLVKAMLVTRGAANGTFPSDFGDTFLIQTIQYGTDTYLQTAYLVQSGYDCYEYRRIYSNGNWTDWVGIDSQIADVANSIQSVKDTADACNASINAVNSEMSTMKSSINGINSSLGGVNNQISAVSNRVSAVENKTARMGATLLYEGNLSSGSWEMPSGWSNYAQYMVVGVVRNGGARVSQNHTKGEVTETDIKYQIHDETEWLRYRLRHNGNNLIVTFDGRSATYEGGGRILQVWGIN